MATLLEGRTWRDLLAVSRAHGLPFHTRMTKAQAKARLYHRLTDDGLLRKTLKRLSGVELAALHALHAAEGQMPLHEFTTAYGIVRCWRPWRTDERIEPWKRPQSIAERLWYLGLVEILPKHPGQVLLPCAVRLARWR